MKPQHIELHIEELVLHGFERKDRYAIGEAIQHELTRLLTEQGVHPSLGQRYKVARVDGGTFDVKQGTKAETIGMHVARTVYRGLKR